jgi:hypothetical protein
MLFIPDDDDPTCTETTRKIPRASGAHFHYVRRDTVSATGSSGISASFARPPQDHTPLEARPSWSRAPK